MCVRMGKMRAKNITIESVSIASCGLCCKEPILCEDLFIASANHVCVCVSLQHYETITIHGTNKVIKSIQFGSVIALIVKG